MNVKGKDMKRIALILFLTATIILSCSDKGSEPTVPPVIYPPGSPVIDSLSADRGWVGDSINIYGENFGDSRGLSSYVKFDTVYAEIIDWSDTEITSRVPQGAKTGNLTVTADSLTGKGVHFTVYGIDRVEPDSADVGDEVRIFGLGFGATQDSSSVSFNGVQAHIDSWSDVLIVTTVPAGAMTGSVTISVDGNFSSHKFVVNGSYGITSVEPEWGPWGTEVTIRGFQFGYNPIDRYVAFNGRHASIVSWANNEIKATVPSKASSGDVIVSVDHLATNGVHFGVFAISTVLPGVAVAGDTIRISGDCFGTEIGDGTVTVGSVPAEATEWSNTFIKAIIPADALDSEVAVERSDYRATYSNLIVTTPPTITEVSPEWGTYGDLVTIRGSGFGDSAFSVITNFNGSAGSVISRTDTEITTQFPNGCRSGDLIVTTYNAISSLPYPFSVFGIRKLVPAWAAIGDTIAVIGTGFGDDAGANYPTLNGTPVTPISWSNDTIRIVVPPDASSGDVAVNIDGKPSNSAAFSLKSEENILGLLQQANRIDVSFSGWISYWGFAYRSFNMEVDSWGTIDWEGTSIHAHRDFQWNWITETTDLKGWVSSDGSTLDSMTCSYVRVDFAGTVSDWIQDTYNFKVIDIPLNYVEGPDDFILTYELGGPDVETHVPDIWLVHEVYYHDGGYSSYHYGGTDWENEAYPPKITVTFWKE